MNRFDDIVRRVKSLACLAKRMTDEGFRFYVDFRSNRVILDNDSFASTYCYLDELEYAFQELEQRGNYVITWRNPTWFCRGYFLIKELSGEQKNMKSKPNLTWGMA